MSRRVRITDTAGRLSDMNTGEGKTTINGASISAAESSNAASAQDTDAILAAVLRVFASRGRAIREERAKIEAACSTDANAPNVLGDQETGSTDQDTCKDMPSP
jgi:hypothetical protein